MNEQEKVYLYREEAVTIYAYWKDFDGDIQKWKNSIYEMFRWDMTYSYAHDILVYESNECGVYIRLIIKPAFEDAVLDTMDSLGFKELKVTHDGVGAIECTDLPDDMWFDYVYID